MNIWQLRTFCAVFKKRSFTKAASVVHRTQPSISAQIAELEKYYGTQLFIRKGKEVSPTESGDILYRYAQRILKLCDESKDALDELGGLTRGVALVGASTIPGTYILPRLLPKFNQEYPEVRVSIYISDTRDVLSRVQDGTLEMGVVGEKVQDERLEFKSLAEDQIVLIASSKNESDKDVPATLHILKKEPFIAREEGSGTRGTVQKALEKQGMVWKDQNVVMELGSTEAVKNAVLAGSGIAFVSQWAIEREKAGGMIHEIQIKGLLIRRDFCLVRHKGWPISRATEAFFNFCVSKAPIPMQRED